MAISYVGGNTGNNTNAGSVTVSLTALTGGSDSSPSTDDLIIVAYGVGDDDFTQPTLAITTAGYTEVTASTLSEDGGTAGDGNLAVFYKYHNGSDTSVVTTAAGTGTDSSTAVAVMVFRGVKLAAGGGPFDVTATTATGTSGGDPDPPSINTSGTAGIWTVIACSLGNTGALTLTAPTNYTTNALNAVGNDNFDASVGLAYRTNPGDPEDPGAWTDSGAGAAWCAVTMALSEAASGDATASPGVIARSFVVPQVTLTTQKRFRYTFEGGSDETTITTSDTGSGEAFDVVNLPAQGGSPAVSEAKYDTAYAAAGTLGGRLRSTDAGGTFVQWSTSIGTATESYARAYLQRPTSLPGNRLICLLRTAVPAQAAGWRFNTSGNIVLVDAGSTARYTSTKAFSSGEEMRIEFHVTHSTTVGHMEARLFYGANLNGTTADETIGNLTDNWDTGADVAQARFGQVSAAGAGTNETVALDALEWNNFEWPGPVATNASVTPATIARAFVIDAVDERAGVSLTPAVIARSVVMDAVDERAGASITPAVIARSVVMDQVDHRAGVSLTPVTIARAFVIDAVDERAGASITPAVIARAFVMDQAQAGAFITITPDTIARAFVMDQATPQAGVSLTPAVIARAFVIDAVDERAGVSLTPATIARAFALPQVDHRAGVSLTPATMARAFVLPQAGPQAGASVTPATMARAFVIDQVTVNAGGGTSVTPAVIARAFVIDQVDQRAGASLTPAVIARAFVIDAAGPQAGASLTPATIARAFALPQATTVTELGASVTPDTIAALIATFTPTLRADVSLTPEPVALIITIPGVGVVLIPPVIVTRIGPVTPGTPSGPPVLITGEGPTAPGSPAGGVSVVTREGS